MKRKKTSDLTPTERLAKIADIIEAVDNRCMAVDGPVTPTHREITAAEILGIYLLAVAKPEKFALGCRVATGKGE